MYRLDEFRLYHHRQPIIVKQNDDTHYYTLFFNESVDTIQSKLCMYPSFIKHPWMITKYDFDLFLKYSRVHCVERDKIRF
jgi:hypothetical protein